MKELDLTVIDMSKFSDNVNKFMNWWNGKETVLKNAETNAARSRPGKDNPRLRAMKKTWTQIRDDYKQYEDQVCQRTCLHESIKYNANLLVKIAKLQTHYTSQTAGT
jgi:hypothetical protein